MSSLLPDDQLFEVIGKPNRKIRRVELPERSILLHDQAQMVIESIEGLFNVSWGGKDRKVEVLD